MDEIVEYEIKRIVELTDGFKYLIFYLRKNGLEFQEISNLIEQLTSKPPHLKTLRSIFISINNRLNISHVYKNNELTFTVIKILADIIQQQLIKMWDSMIRKLLEPIERTAVI